MLLECSALADFREELSPHVADCSGVMTRVVWAKNSSIVSKYGESNGIANLEKAHADDVQTLFHPFSLKSRPVMNKYPYLLST